MSISLLAIASATLAYSSASEAFRLECHDDARENHVVVRAFGEIVERTSAPVELTWSRRGRQPVSRYEGTLYRLPEPPISAPGRPVPPLSVRAASARDGRAFLSASFEPLVARLRWGGCFGAETYRARIAGLALTCDWVMPPCESGHD